MEQRIMLTLSDRAPREARDFFDRFDHRISPALLDDLRIMTSEIVTNSVEHSGRPQGDPIEVTTSITTDMVRVEVRDEGRGIVPLKPRSSEPPSGLQYVELLSDRWSGRRADSFHVWFEVDTDTRTPLITRKYG